MASSEIELAQAPLKTIEQVKNDLKAWETQSLMIGVFGEVKSGKSTFINLVRGVTHLDLEKKDAMGRNLYAKTGITETTTEVEEYAFPDNPNVRLFDVPGAGTMDFNDFCQMVDIKKFDAFIYFMKETFTETDHQILSKIKELGKPYLFCRTMLDIDAQNLSRNNPINVDFHQLWKEEMDAVIKEAKDLMNEDSTERIFLISYLNELRLKRHQSEDVVLKFDGLEKAKCYLANKLEGLQKEAFLFSLKNLTKDTLKLKMDILKRRVWMVVAASTVAGAMPIPGLNVAIDAGI